ncbi:hypothetical protein ANANG_G00240950 [Anguilla anguilla]|uniref:Uncharacterized protein n=1 Tax=Anguilla anguilla TaxID=7936 RepID=A0A9D3LWD5_ANGAN|nr:hypothetical protein ANANG_G00240950 [Anguilla anguilla]
MSWRPRAACTSIVSVLRRICLPHMSLQGELCLKQTVDMDDEDGRCLLDVICDPQALNDFLHGSETHVHVPQVQPSNQLSVSDPSGLPSSSVDLDFLEDDDILGAGRRGGAREAAAAARIFHSPAPSATATPPGAAPDVMGSVLAHPGLQLQPQVMSKAVAVQPFMQQVGLGNVTLQPISGLQALPNGGPAGHLGLGQIQVMGQPTVMAINPSGQPILAKTMSGYQLHQAGPDAGGTAAQAGLGGAVLGSGGGLLIQGGKPAVGARP